MSFPVQILYYLGGASAVVAVALTFIKGEQRRRIGDFLLLLLTLFVAGFLIHAFAGNKLGKSNGAVAAEQSEIQLRVIGMARAIQTTAYRDLAAWLGESPKSQTGAEVSTTSHGNTPGEGQKDKKNDIDVQMEQKVLKEAGAALQKAIDQNPASSIYKAKMAVLLEAFDAAASADKIANLVKQVSATEGNDDAAKAMRSLGAVLEGAYVSKRVPLEAVDADARVIETALSAGWYRDHALDQLYTTAGDRKALNDHRSEVDHKYLSVFLKLMMIGAVVIVGGLIGLATIIVQAALISRDRTGLPDEVGLNMPWRTIYGVFIGWFAIEIMMSFGYHFLQGKLPSVSTHAFAVALSTAITYVLSNVAGPLLIWWLAFKPQNLNFWKALHITDRTSTAGRGKLVGAGVLGWCSALPLVFSAALIAHQLFGVQGSDNPVLGQIMQAASASSIPATAIFYLTLGVLAPLFEETLFRGFIYASLKPKIGSAWAIVASAAVFALMHFDRGGSLMLFVIGVVLAFLFERTRSLVPSMICHGMWNSGTFTFALLLFGS